MKKIYLDTNFLLIPAQFGVDIFEETKKACDFPYRIHVLKESIDELENIVKSQSGKNKAAAKLGLEILKRKLKEKSLNITAFSKEGNVDDILVAVAGDDTIIATQDKELKNRVKQKGFKVLILRSKKYMQIMG